ncbi:MAG: hypothetical protein JNK85_13490 [Verrucomicrobiales bacterium]|nr:hypothetical protein [Verrucomicrobiales bacterium]
MKSILKACLVLGLVGGPLSVPALAQGTLLFSTRAGGVVSAPVSYLGDGSLVDGRFFGQLYAGAPGGTLVPIGIPRPFRSDVGRGYITDGGIVEVPGVAPGSPAQVKLVAWASWRGDTYAEAVMTGMGDIGESAMFTVDLGGGIMPPGMLLGLQAFAVSIIIPEASPLSYALLGLGLLGLCRRKAGHPARR